MSILMKRKRRTFVKIDDFEKKYVTNVVLNEGDKILITEDNIEALRKILKQSNFHWFADHEPVADGYDFQPNRVITLDERQTVYSQLHETDKYDLDAINYVFVNF
jgi:hypothetical protein